MAEHENPYRSPETTQTPPEPEPDRREPRGMAWEQIAFAMVLIVWLLPGIVYLLLHFGYSIYLRTKGN